MHTTEADDGDDRNTQSLLFACTLAEKNCTYYPNIHAILLLILSLPIGSHSCERSFSSLRRLKTWCRNSMSDERLDSLAVGFINHERTPSPDKVCSKCGTGQDIGEFLYHFKSNCHSQDYPIPPHIMYSLCTHIVIK